MQSFYSSSSAGAIFNRALYLSGGIHSLLSLLYCEPHTWWRFKSLACYTSQRLCVMVLENMGHASMLLPQILPLCGFKPAISFCDQAFFAQSPHATQGASLT